MPEISWSNAMVRFALSLTLAVVLTSCGFAQTSLYTTNQMNQLKNRNSATQFTSQQITNNVINRSVPRYNFSNVNQNILSPKAPSASSVSPMKRAKPFSQVTQQPSTSPYLGLLAENPFTSTTTNYFNSVRPRIEQQRMNERLQAQNMRMQQQLNEIAAKGPYSTTGSEDRAPTGHAAAYMNTAGTYGNRGGYFPEVPIKSVRGQK
jgi:hypothetical protein